jgi:hypothetical protein
MKFTIGGTGQNDIEIIRPKTFQLRLSRCSYGEMRAAPKEKAETIMKSLCTRLIESA